MIAKGFSKPTERVERLRNQIIDAVPHIESDRAKLLTESYRRTENEPMVLRRAKAMDHILTHLPVVIRDDELLVGTLTRHTRSCQVYPEFSYKWLIEEFDTIADRMTDKFVIEGADKQILRDVLPYWDGKTINDLTLSYMEEDSKNSMNHSVFNIGNYWFTGIGHIIIDYAKAIGVGYRAIVEEAAAVLQQLEAQDPDYQKKAAFLKAEIIIFSAAIKFAHRYADKAQSLAAGCSDPARKAELERIAANCRRVPEYPAENFWEACQAFIFTQMIVQLESSGHSVSPGRFDQYMYPYFKTDQSLTRDQAQELLDCVFVKLNDLNKVRDAVSAQAFAGYQVFQNIGAGGQTADGQDATNDISYMMIETVAHLRLSAPSFSIRVWEGTPDEFLYRACELCRLGYGLPAMYNDEVIIPALVNRGIDLYDARNFGLIGCVEPSVPGKEQGWHDAGFFNVAKVLEITMNNGRVDGDQIGPKTGEVSDFKTYEAFIAAFKTQLAFFVRQVVNAINSMDYAHRERVPLPFLSGFVADCIAQGTDINAGGAKYNFSGPQAFGVADAGDSLCAIKKHVFEQKDVTFEDLKDALDHNFGYPVSSELTPIACCPDVKTITTQAPADLQQTIYDTIIKVIGDAGGTIKAEPAAAAGDNPYERIKRIMENTDWYGNDIDAADMVARQVGQTYCYEVQKYRNPRGGQFQAGIYPVSANVLFGKDVGAMADGRLATKPLADGCSPRAGMDTNGPTAAANSVAKLEHELVSNGSLYNMKLLPESVDGDQGLKNFAGLVRSYFAHKGQHIQFNVVNRDKLLDAQQHPEAYRDLVVRVAGYSAMFVELAKEVQDDIIHRTEQSF